MWFASLRDLQWRRRRFAIGVGATALVFAVTLIMASLPASLRGEASRTIRATGADAWVVPPGVGGPLTGLAVMPAARVDEVRRAPGVRQADPVLLLHDAVEVRGRAADVLVIGHRPGGLGSPNVRRGRAVTGPNEAVVDGRLKLAIGGTFELAGRPVRVVGTTRGMSVEGGVPVVFLNIGTVQEREFYGAPIALAILTRGVPRSLPAGLRSFTPDQVTKDVLRRLDRAVKPIDLVKTLLWGVAAAVVGSLVYLTAIERTRDMAVLKATGASNRDLLIGLALQGVLIALTAALVSIALARLLVPIFPLPLVLSVRAILSLPLVALAVGLLASVASIRRAATVDPALAFSG
jgi:putative ABC transport system permease protein